MAPERKPNITAEELLASVLGAKNEPVKGDDFREDIDEGNFVADPGDQDGSVKP